MYYKRSKQTLKLGDTTSAFLMHLHPLTYGQLISFRNIGKASERKGKTLLQVEKTKEGREVRGSEAKMQKPSSLSTTLQCHWLNMCNLIRELSVGYTNLIQSTGIISRGRLRGTDFLVSWKGTGKRRRPGTWRTQTAPKTSTVRTWGSMNTIENETRTSRTRPLLKNCNQFYTVENNKA